MTKLLQSSIDRRGFLRRGDTLGDNPGERWDVIIDCQNVGVWPFHCHILTHAEGHSGMYGMDTALIVQA